MAEKSDFPYFYHPDLGVVITIKDKRAFLAAKIFWDALEASYIPRKERHAIRGADGRFINSLDIPFNYETHPTEYRIAWVLCKKHHAKYPDAVAAEKKINPQFTGVALKTDVLIFAAELKRWSDEEDEFISSYLDDKKPAAGWEEYNKRYPGRRTIGAYRQHLWQLQVAKKEKEQKVSQEQPQVIKKSEKRKSTASLPTDTQPSTSATITPPPAEPKQPSADLAKPAARGVFKSFFPGEQKIPPKKQTSADGFVVGVCVKQIAGVRILYGIGEITRAPLGSPEVLVGFEKGVEWLRKENLEIIPSSTDVGNKP